MAEIHVPTGEEYVSLTHTHVWRKVENIKVGDKLHRWGDNLEVLDIRIKNKISSITVKETDGTQKTWDYSHGKELIVLV